MCSFVFVSGLKNVTRGVIGISNSHCEWRSQHFPIRFSFASSVFDGCFANRNLLAKINGLGPFRPPKINSLLNKPSILHFFITRRLQCHFQAHWHFGWWKMWIFTMFNFLLDFDDDENSTSSTYFVKINLINVKFNRKSVNLIHFPLSIEI